MKFTRMPRANQVADEAPAASEPTAAAAPAPVAMAAPVAAAPVAGGPVTDRPVTTAEIVRAIVALKLKKKVRLALFCGAKSTRPLNASCMEHQHGH
jgi:3-oxoacyl-ACP reductase-like protein